MVLDETGMSPEQFAAWDKSVQLSYLNLLHDHQLSEALRKSSKVGYQTIIITAAVSTLATTAAIGGIILSIASVSLENKPQHFHEPDIPTLPYGLPELAPPPSRNHDIFPGNSAPKCYGDDVSHLAEPEGCVNEI